MQFNDFGIDKRLLATIAHLGFDQPTAIQQQAIPCALQGQDLIASSQTGSGKTLAFLIPAMQRLIKQRALSKRDPRVLILAPTRELAKQVFGQLRLLTGNTQFKAVLILGGENFNDQVNVLEKDPHFIVATPGRLVDHLKQGHFYLHGLELLILDEADRMLDLGFAQQLTDINNAADHRKRQTLLFSATLEHAQVNEFAQILLNKPKRIAIGHAYTEHQDILKRFYLADNLEQKQALLAHLLQHESFQQMIIFTATRADTERLAQLLQTQHYNAVALSGELAQNQRNQIMDSFSKGQHKILVTTDLASRGLDLVNVSHVINFDMPKHAEEFVHRIGRTGRAGEQGDAISFVGPKDWLSFQNVSAFLQQEVNFSTIAGIDVKFSGIKRKTTSVKKVSKLAKSKLQPAAKKHIKRNNKTFHLAEDVGDMPVMKRKQPIPLTLIDDDNTDEVE